jgi:DNA-binding CsgD family transcriptional regulator
MRKLPQETNHRLLSFSGPSAKTTFDVRDSGASNIAELMVGGRRYRLVPVDPDGSDDAGTMAAELLTPRELQIVVLVANGYVNKQVADALRISEWTVSTHLRRIFAKLGVDTRAAMVSRCFCAFTASKKEI